MTNMRPRDFFIWILALGGLVLSILTLMAGWKVGTLNTYTIATVPLPASLLGLKLIFNTLQYTYKINNDVLYPPANATTAPTPYGTGPWAKETGDEIHWFFFTVHYLSLCGGYGAGTENENDVFLKCERKAAGWIFTTDDPFIVNFLSVDEQFPVNSTATFQSFTTAPAFGTLVIGIALSAFSVGVLAVELIGDWLNFEHLAHSSIWLLAGASMFLVISSALITSIIVQTGVSENEYSTWISGFEAITWSSVAFTYIAFIWKLVDIIWQREKRRHLLNTRQIQ